MRLTLVAGRDLRFGPAWACSDARLVFDRNSGDFWAMSEMGVAMLDMLRNESNGLSMETVDAEMRRQFPESDGDAVAAVGQSLVDARLLQH